MHALCEYIDKELKNLERKAEQSGDLSEKEVAYGKDLAKFKMALLTNKAMENESGYSYDYRGDMPYADRMYNHGRVYDDMSYARGRTGNVRRDSIGRYSGEGRSYGDYSSEDTREDLMESIHEFMKTAPEEQKRAAQNFMNRIK